MGEINVTVNEAQLKGRRTSLGKKTQEELINIILRKDKTERNNNAKIKSLQDANFDFMKSIDALRLDAIDKQDKINFQSEQISNMNADIVGMENNLRAKNEIIEGQKVTINNYYNDLMSKDKEIVRLKDKCNLFRKVIWTCFGIIIVLGIIMCVI